MWFQAVITQWIDGVDYLYVVYYDEGFPRAYKRALGYDTTWVCVARESRKESVKTGTATRSRVLDREGSSSYYLKRLSL